MELGDDLFKTLVESVGDGVYFVDTARNIQYWNTAAARITGYTSEEVVGKNCASEILRHIDEQGQRLCQGLCPLAKTMADGEVRQVRVFLHHKDGHRVPVRVVSAAVRGPDNAIIGGIETFQDDSETVAALREVEDLKRASLTCPLTGVGNRRFTEDILSQRVAEAERTGKTFAVMMLDIDHFKSVNDRFGHQAGDLVLKMVARTLQNAMRSYDFVGRWGGEEFVAIMSNISWPKLEDAANRLRILIERSSRQVSSDKLTVTVSIGACLYHPGDTPGAVVDRADKLMYESKNSGRNRVTVPDAPPPAPEDKEPREADQPQKSAIFPTT